MWSQRLHKCYSAVLISSKLLRRLHCGQIDIAFMNDNFIYLLEVKSSSRISPKQIRRLQCSELLIGRISSLGTKLFVAFGQKDILPLRGNISTLNI